jgi:phage terminase large subunit GpA-like protein
MQELVWHGENKETGCVWGIVWENDEAFRPIVEDKVDCERAIQYRRTGFVAGKVPNDIALRDAGSPILIVVASVDVQNDCLYVDVKGYADGGSTWTLEFFEIKGNTADFNGPWDKLNEFIDGKRYVGNDGKTYQIAITLIDSGYNTTWAHAFAQRYASGVYACKGKDWIAAGESYQLFSPGALQRIGMERVYHVNTGKLKDKISAALMSSFWSSNECQPHWYPNFPKDFHDDYFKMFEAETKKEKRDPLTNKFKGYVWQLAFGKPNHAFDAYVYNLAALEILAEYYCKEWGLAALNWDYFWATAKTGCLSPTEG